MRDVLEYLNRDRQVNKAFIERLEKAGFEIEYGTYSYWNGQPYVQIGRAKVWLVTTKYFDNGNSWACVYRYRNDVVKEIIETIDEQKKLMEEADQLVNEFFEKLNR